MVKTLRSLKFLVTGPLILAFLLAVDVMTPGGWWIQWPALGIGLAWIFSLFRVASAVVVAGGLAAFATYLARR